jgi:benzoyl-CoA 2,3-dioxygenase component A
MNSLAQHPVKQHLIDPEICIRCNTCEETCPADAITHDANNYVVDASKCNFCMDCISPCPTGSIDNWRIVLDAFSLDEQMSWSELPAQAEITSGADGASQEAEALLAEAHAGMAGMAVAPASAATPAINLFNRDRPAIATVTGNFRLTDAGAENDVRHIILDFGDIAFPVLEGQSIGIVAPGVDADGAPHRMRLYSISSPRHGEKPNANNLSLTVKREANGLCSNYVCDLKKGDRVAVTGPFGGTFLMPNDPAANIVMICTGTGSAPFRGFTEWRRRTMAAATGRMMLFFGARRPEELPYFGPLQKVPDTLLAKHFAYSRLPDAPKTYVQDLLREQADTLAPLLRDDRTHIYVCGLKGMEQGVEQAFDGLCQRDGLDWTTTRVAMRDQGRYHVETY